MDEAGCPARQGCAHAPLLGEASGCVGGTSCPSPQRKVQVCSQPCRLPLFPWESDSTTDGTLPSEASVDRTGQDRTGERSARQAWQPGGESLTLHPSRATVRALVFPRPCSLKGSCLACRWRAHWARPTPWLVVRIQEVGPRGAHRKAPCELDAELRVWRKSSTKARLEGRGPGEAGLPAGPTSQHPAGPAPGGPPWNA